MMGYVFLFFFKSLLSLHLIKCFEEARIPEWMKMKETKLIQREQKKKKKKKRDPL